MVEARKAVLDAILSRRSIRQYTDDPVEEEDVRTILEAARWAPSGLNNQPWRFVVVRNPETRKKISEAACRQKFVASAPVVLACCAETNNHVMTCGQLSYPIDVAIAIDHITLCAAAEGLGTCWIGAFYEEDVKTILGIPADIRVVALLPIGYPQDPSSVGKFRLPVDEIVSYESW